MAKWLDRLKSCFGRKTGEIAYATATKNIGRSVAVTGVELLIEDQRIVGFAPECTIRDEVETFTPKVGQLMLNKYQIQALLQTYSSHSVLKTDEGWVIWNAKKQKYQTIRSTPMVAVRELPLYINLAEITVYGVDLIVRRDQLQFK